MRVDERPVGRDRARKRNGGKHRLLLLKAGMVRVRGTWADTTRVRVRGVRRGGHRAPLPRAETDPMGSTSASHTAGSRPDRSSATATSGVRVIICRGLPLTRWVCPVRRSISLTAHGSDDRSAPPGADRATGPAVGRRGAVILGTSINLCQAAINHGMTIITTDIVEYCKGKFTPKLVVFLEDYSTNRCKRQPNGSRVLPLFTDRQEAAALPRT